MTEDKAKTKLCCGPAQIAAQFMGENVIKPHAMCAGSACMAWRWEPQRYEHHSNDYGTYINTDENTNRFGVKGKALPREGFCGLAGKP